MHTMDPKKSAAMLFASVWEGRPFPVDPIWIAHQLGVDVIEATLPSDVSGAIIKDAGKDPVIALCSSDSDNRKRFTCAHEIGHYIYRMEKGEDHYQFIDLRSPDSRNGMEPEEIFANQFAASLLMPEDEVRKLCREKVPQFMMTRHFGVSDDAIYFRLKNLSLLTSYAA